MLGWQGNCGLNDLHSFRAFRCFETHFLPRAANHGGRESCGMRFSDRGVYDMKRNEMDGCHLSLSGASSALADANM